jgi:nucleoside-diphosphate-sugar epimerase
MQKNILIIGYGDIAKRLIKVLGTEFISIYAISRNDSIDQNINKINWDWLSDEMVNLKVKNFDSVIIIPKPSSLDEKGYVEGFVLATQNILKLLSNVNLNRVIAVSSTRVYGNTHKGLVDESFIEKPSDYRGELIMKYESALSKTYGPRLTILRFSGLYDNQSNKITHNKLHRDQAAKIIAHFMGYQSENSQTNIINCAEDSKISSSEKSIGNAKLKKTGFNF